MGDVVSMSDYGVKPKQLSKQYAGQKYVVTYVPATKRWSWCCEVVHTVTIRGEADTQVKAVREAEREISKMMKMQGKEVG